MNKEKLIAKVFETTDLSKRDATTAVNSVFDLITETIESGEKVKIIGFGSFEARERKERNGRNPQTGDPIHIEASRTPVFKAAKTLKERIKQ